MVIGYAVQLLLRILRAKLAEGLYLDGGVLDSKNVVLWIDFVSTKVAGVAYRVWQ